jgi:hypothetical protein
LPDGGPVGGADEVRRLPDVRAPDVAPPDVAPPDVAPLDVAPPDVAPPDAGLVTADFPEPTELPEVGSGEPGSPERTVETAMVADPVPEADEALDELVTERVPIVLADVGVAIDITGLESIAGDLFDSLAHPHARPVKASKVRHSVVGFIGLPGSRPLLICKGAGWACVDTRARLVESGLVGFSKCRPRAMICPGRRRPSGCDDHVRGRLRLHDAGYRGAAVALSLISGLTRVCANLSRQLSQLVRHVPTGLARHIYRSR